MLIMCNHAISKRRYYNISPCWSSLTAGILVHYRRCNLTLLESRSRADAGVRLNSRYYQVVMLETCSTGWRSSSDRLETGSTASTIKQLLETGSTAGAGDLLNSKSPVEQVPDLLNSKSGKMQLHISFERREGNS